MEDFSDLQTVESVKAKETAAKATIHESCFQRAVICENNDLVVDDKFPAWQFLGFLDAHVTESFIDSAFVKNHKLCCHDNVVELISQNQKLYDLIYRAYLESTEFVQYTPTPLYPNMTNSQKWQL